MVDHSRPQARKWIWPWLLDQIRLQKFHFTFQPSLTSSCLVPSCNHPEIQRCWADPPVLPMNISEACWCQQHFSAYKERIPLCRRLPDTPYVWRTLAELSLLFTKLRVTPSLSPQHHGQHPDSPPCGYLLLRLPVARSCWGHLAGDTLIRFHTEIPAGERSGEAAWKGHGVKCGHWSGCL